MKFKLNMKVQAHKRHTECLQDKAAFDVTPVLVIYMKEPVFLPVEFKDTSAPSCPF
jgi:hypothetical protein